MFKKLSSFQLLLGGFLAPVILALLILGGVVLAKTLNTSSGDEEHVRGNKKSSVTLIEYSDFQCPYCQQYYPVLKKILEDYKDKVKVVYKHYPLNFHPEAQKAAEASECANEQGKFWEMHDMLFENQESLGINNYKAWAVKLGQNSKKFNDCLDSGKYGEKISKDYNEGVQKGVEGTPATFINGELISGAVPYETLKEKIDALLK